MVTVAGSLSFVHNFPGSASVRPFVMTV